MEKNRVVKSIFFPRVMDGAVVVDWRKVSTRTSEVVTETVKPWTEGVRVSQTVIRRSYRLAA